MALAAVATEKVTRGLRLDRRAMAVAAEALCARASSALRARGGHRCPSARCARDAGCASRVNDEEEIAGAMRLCRYRGGRPPPQAASMSAAI